MKILLTGAFTYTQEQIDLLRDMRHTVLYVQDERVPLVEQGIDPKDIEGVVCNGLFLYNDLSQFEKLRYVQLTSAGFDRVALDEMQKRAITVYNARGVYSAPMAELALCGVLQLYKQSAVFTENQRAHRWEKLRNLKELTDKTVCIIGCGSVGQACAKRFAAFDCHVVGVDIVTVDAPCFEKQYLLQELDTALTQSDVVVLTLPLTAETRGLFNRERFNKCKADAIFVNVARGAVVVEQDLITALKNGQLGGAVLDVFDTEPLPADNPLWDMENVVITPHNCFVGDGTNKRLFDVIIRNLKHEGAV